jgi:N-acetylglutamate synthase
VPTRTAALVRHMPVEDLQAVAALGWRAVDSDRLGDWRLRASAGFTDRANSVLAMGDPGCPPDQAVNRAVQWYLARQLRPLIMVPLPFAAGLGGAAFEDHRCYLYRHWPRPAG